MTMTSDTDLLERLVRLETKIDLFLERLESEKTVRVDHEARLRRLEKWMFMLPASLLVALLAAASERGFI
jgi:hypothetical protein